ncbi:MAG: hypothetical protein N4A49_01215 [Marinifilaceae bacterium]|nr:hypothetical protein [Marinifilaceae bacterium]
MSKEFRDALIKETYINAIINIYGPTGSGKSTILGFLVNPEDNKKLSNNIGEKNQKSLFKFKLSLNAMMKINKVCIRAIKKILRTDYSRNIIPILAELVYELVDNSDNIDSLEIDSDHIREMFEPKNKEYKAYDYLKKELSDKIDILVNELKKLAGLIWDGLEEACKQEFNRRKVKKGPKLSKKNIFLQEIEIKLYNNIENTELGNWFEEFDISVVQYYTKFFDDIGSYEIFGDVTDEKIDTFISAIFDDNSVFSLVFSEVIYITKPSNEFLDFYNKYYKTSDKPFVLNLLDTMGITHISDEKEFVSNAIDGVLANSFDASLFICKSDEKDTVYENCIDILSKKKGLENRPFTVCRTKADILIKSKANNAYKRDTGRNEIPEKEVKRYYENALNEYKENNLYLDKNKDNVIIGDNEYNDNDKVEFISLSPNDTKELKIALEEELDESKIFKILLNLKKAVDKQYSDKGILVATRKISNKEGVVINLLGDDIFEIANYLVETNKVHEGGQYFRYLNGSYHGRSISNYYYKHMNGVGHATDSQTRENFRLFIANMIRAWLRKSNIFSEDMLLFNLDVSNLIVEENEVIDRVKSYIMKYKDSLIIELAKKLSYDYLAVEFGECYYACSWQVGFKRNLQIFHNKFSDKIYWEKSINDWLKLKLNIILNNIVYVR